MTTTQDPVRVGLVTTSDRATDGVYQDRGISALTEWSGRTLRNPATWDARLIADEQARLKAAPISLVDHSCCDFTALPYCIDLIGGPYLETDEAVCKAFRPKSAVRPPRTAG